MLIFQNALLIDGTGAPARTGSVAVDGERIVAVGEVVVGAGDTVIDLQGKAIAPGFIDSHTHDDGYLLVHRDMTPKVSQGITSVVTGNCGISLAPLVAEQVPQPLDLLGSPELFRFERFAQWLQALEAAPSAVNVIPLVGHTTLRVKVMDDTQREATPQECARMRELLSEALDDGAFGISTGTFYPPARSASLQELLAVCKPLRGRRAVYATHLRDEADEIVPAMEEALTVGQEADCRVIFSHHKLAGERNHGRSAETLALIEQASAAQPVCVDCHPYPATSTMLRLDRVRLARRTMITWSKSRPEAKGRDFADLQREWQLDDEATLARLAPAGAIYFLMAQEDVDRIFQFPLTMVGSDGLPFDPHPHPRQWGTFTRVLKRMVRECGLLRLEEAIYRMTGLASEQYGLTQRGMLKPGWFADLVIFDPQQVADAATFEEPMQISEGIAQVWVNGQQVWAESRATGALPGQVLRRQEPVAA
ncbi:amidohydrolase family protein [Comamonas sp. J-3]|uniref:N-acyl-D-amino-acid deacylase family protein n=1 Tax=Comamonas trifloxystrobinivorans TaxID=3350256 RepID=UPI003727673B